MSEPPFITEDNMLEVFGSIDGAHAEMMNHGHDGLCRCNCGLAKLARQLYRHYSETYTRLYRRKRRSEVMKRAWEKRKAKQAVTP